MKTRTVKVTKYDRTNDRYLVHLDRLTFWIDADVLDELKDAPSA